jgi:hypothetical protein
MRSGALRHLASILLLVTFLGLGTGTLAYLHDRQHEAADAAEDRAARAAGLPVEHHHHDETNCRVHAQLHMPMVAGRWVAPLATGGLLVGTLSLLRPTLLHRDPPARFDCRDPPLTVA